MSSLGATSQLGVGSGPSYQHTRPLHQAMVVGDFSPLLPAGRVPGLGTDKRLLQGARLSEKVWEALVPFLEHSVYEEPSLTHVHPAFILHLFHLRGLRTPCPASQRSVGCSHAPQTLSAHSGAAALQGGTSCSTTPFRCCLLPITSLPAPPALLPSQNAPSFIFHPRGFSCHHPLSSRIFSREIARSHAFAEIQHPRDKEEAPSCTSQSRARDSSAHSWHQARMVVLCPGPTSVQTLQACLGWAQLTFPRGCRDTAPRAAAPHAGSGERWNRDIPNLPGVWTG